MKIEIEFPDDALASAVREAVRRGDSSWRRGLENKAEAAIENALRGIDLTGPAQQYVARLVDEVLENQVRARLRYIVKLAVDNELAIPRLAEQLRATSVPAGKGGGCDAE